MLATPAMADMDGLAGAFAAAVVGGAGSRVGGGSFANGALTGAFGYLFNDMAVSRSTSIKLYGRYAAGIGDTLCSPACIHLAIVISDNYNGVTLMDGQPTVIPLPTILSSSKLSYHELANFQTNSVFSIELPVPVGMSERGFAQTLIEAGRNFHSGLLPYTIPSLPDGSMGSGKYNSNSFASGLLQSVYGSVPQISFGKMQAPGWKNPIPSVFFQR